MSEWCTSKRTSEWPSTFAWILVVLDHGALSFVPRERRRDMLWSFYVSAEFGLSKGNSMLLKIYFRDKSLLAAQREKRTALRAGDDDDDDDHELFFVVLFV